MFPIRALCVPRRFLSEGELVDQQHQFQQQFQLQAVAVPVASASSSSAQLTQTTPSTVISASHLVPQEGANTTAATAGSPQQRNFYSSWKDPVVEKTLQSQLHPQSGKTVVGVN